MKYYPFPSLPFVLMFILIANLILNYSLYENTVETQYCILFLEKPLEIKLILKLKKLYCHVMECNIMILFVFNPSLHVLSIINKSNQI